MADYLVPLDVAEREFEQFCEANCIDIDQDVMDEEDLKDFITMRRKITFAVQTGRMRLVNGDTYELDAQIGDETKTLILREPTSAESVSYTHLTLPTKRIV